MVSCRIQIWQILDFEILEDGLGLVVDEYFFHGKGATSGDKVHDRQESYEKFELLKDRDSIRRSLAKRS